MSLTIIKVFNPGEKNERLSLRVISDCDLRNFAVVDLTYDENSNESNVYRHFYRFSSIRVSEGDIVRLYTGKGRYKTSVGKDKRTIHEVYWGSGSTIWNQDGDKVEVLSVRTISSKNVN